MEEHFRTMELTETVFLSVRHRGVVKTHQTVSSIIECIHDEYTQSQGCCFLKLCQCLCFLYIYIYIYIYIYVCVCVCVSNFRMSLWPQFCEFLMLFSSFEAFLLFHFEQSYVA